METDTLAPVARADGVVPGGDFVDVEDPEVVTDWTRSLGISKRELLDAVEIVGPAAGNVYDYIRKRQQLAPSAEGR